MSDKLRQVRGNGRRDDYENDEDYEEGARGRVRIRKTRGRVNSEERYQDEQPSCRVDFRASFDARHDGGGIGRTEALITEVYELRRDEGAN